MAKSIMVQGTMSNAGKSVLAAGLCRIFRQDGLSCAPFKAQNMALNSFITKEGLEMGRAQVMQAEAAGIEPEVAMNPVLLKPTNDVGSQVIVNGTSIGNMSARDYFSYKKELIPVVQRAYESLAERFDVVVIEGAGSPAEINLKDDDCFVNMDMAKMAKAPVLLVGDIDRGGVFAQLYGTASLLTPEEQSRVKGLVINKFRGDRTLLDPGISGLEQMLGIPVVGTIPYVPLQIDDEDSLTERFGSPERKKADAAVDIAVIRYPRISNFSDFSVFDMYERAQVRYVTVPSELGRPDLIVLPGSKDTIGDLLYLKSTGLAGALQKAKEDGTLILGICGGYQMLGETISDPTGAEHEGSETGLGFLPMHTEFSAEKRRVQVSGTFAAGDGPLKDLAHLPVRGYEMHMGVSTPDKEAGKRVSHFTEIGAAGGQIVPDGMAVGNVFGTYVHGIFDDGASSARLLNILAGRKGLGKLFDESQSFRLFHEKQYDILADTVRCSMDMKAVYRILEEGI